SGIRVLLCDLQQSFLDRGVATIEKNLTREVSKDKLTQQEASEALARIALTTDREALGSCTFAIEAATEKFEVKSALFRDLDRILPAEAVLASNTSSISITKLAAQTSRPAQ